MRAQSRKRNKAIKVKAAITKKNGILAGIVAVISVIAHFLAGISFFNVCLFTLLYLFVKSIEVELNGKWNGIWAGLALGGSSIFTTWLMQYLLLVQDLRGKISDEKFFLNILCCLICYLIVLSVTNHVALTGIITHITLLVFAGVNFFVYEFRGNELTFGDLKSVSTGISVASNYHFSLNAQAVNAILITVVYVAMIRKIPVKFSKKWAMRMVCMSFALLSAVYIAKTSQNTVTETWEQKGTYRNGYFLNFVLSIRDSFVEKPEGYSADAVAEIEKSYGDAKADVKTQKPAIIVIMDESFADFSVIGDLITNREVTPFIDSLEENTIKGYAISSVFGAKTPNSEWEFMTGNSMAWLPSGSVVYQQYLKEKNAYSIVDTLKKEDYTCVAMHPYYATGWSRDTVYPKLGFDEVYFLESFDQSNLMRKYVSDETMFEQVIERYEAGKGQENLFLMGITMQNHGGYVERYDNFTTDVFGMNISYPDVNQYLSLVRRTDLAVEKLLGYFSDVEEPVVICFFGDHQPSLNTAFYHKLNGKGLSGLTLDELQELYEVPFFIWTNYESESVTMERTSLNFLSTLLLERAGIPLPPYQSFLADLMQKVPAMNARAFYSESTGRYVHYEKASGEEAEWLKKYQILQYNGLFGKKEQSQLFFGR